MATLAAVPVIITAIALGTKAGALMGLVAGTFSFLVWTFMPPTPITAFIFTPFYSIGDVHGNFWSLVICFVPRILIGVVAGATYHAFSRIFKKKFLMYGLSGILGSLANTFGVMGGVYVFFGQEYAQAMNMAYNLLLGIIGTTILLNGTAEAVIGGVAAAAICPPLQKVLKKSNGL